MNHLTGISVGIISFGIFWALGAFFNVSAQSRIVQTGGFLGRTDVVSTEAVMTTHANMTTDDIVRKGIDVSVVPSELSNREYSWSNVSDDYETAGMLALIDHELGEYSSDYLKKIGLHRIVLVDNIKNSSSQPVLGFSDPQAGEIYLNSVATDGEYSRTVIAEQTVHHEIGHFLAYSEYGVLFERRSEWPMVSEEDSYAKQASSKSEYFPEDGFVSRYAMTSASEDFA